MIKKIIYDKEKVAELVKEAEANFWAYIADSFPDITSGDFPPDATIKLEKQLNESVQLWITVNSETMDVDFE
jgi:hypothetical protein